MDRYERSRSPECAGKMVLTVFAGIAEFERALIRDRTGLGRIAAKKRGVKFGRKPKLTPEQVVLALRLVEGQSVPQVAETLTFGVHENDDLPLPVG